MNKIRNHQIVLKNGSASSAKWRCQRGRHHAGSSEVLSKLRTVIDHVKAAQAKGMPNRLILAGG
jgi:hypothetical protein